MRRLLGNLIPNVFKRSGRSVVVYPPTTTSFRHSILQSIIAVRLKHQEVTNRCSEMRCDILGCLLQGGSYRGAVGLSGNEQDTLDDQARLYAASYLRDMYAVGGLLLLLTFLQLLSQRVDLQNMKTVKTVQHRGETVVQRYECPPNLASAMASTLWASSLFPAELSDLRMVVCQLFGDDWCRRAAENQLPNAPVHARIYQLLYSKQVREPSEKECLLLIEEMYQELELVNQRRGKETPQAAVSQPSVAGLTSYTSVRGSSALPRIVPSDPRISALGSGSLYEPRVRLEAIKLGTSLHPSSPPVWPSCHPKGPTMPSSVQSPDSDASAAVRPGSTNHHHGMFIPAPAPRGPEPVS